MIEKLQEIIIHYTADKDIQIKEDMILLTDLGLNSLELIEMVCEVEEAFEVEIPDKVISSIKTIKDLIDYLSAHE